MIEEKFARAYDGKVRLDLGCGKSITAGYDGVDKHPTEGVKYQVDFEKEALPFEDNSVDEIICRHLIEHVEDLFGLMAEIHRVLKPKGKLNIVVPHYKSRHAFQDPTHIRFFTEKTFRYWDGKYIQQYADYAPKGVFSTEELFVHGEDWEHLWIFAVLVAEK